MSMLIREAVPEDAKEMLELLKIIGGESDNLTFGSEGVGLTVEEEVEYIEAVLQSKTSILLVAIKNGKIVGQCNLCGALSGRLKHRRELGIAVIKSEWDSQIGTKLMEQAINFAKEVHVEVISLEVRSDNQRAIHLYEKFDFQKIGAFKNYLKIGEKRVDFDLMNLYL